MEPIDPNGLKAELPKELRVAMKLDEDQFEELEVNTLHICIQYADVCADLDFGEEPSTMEVAYRPSRNPRGQYYAVEYSLMIDPKTRGMRCEVMAFKPMNRTEYIAYCIKEYGEAPTGLVEDPTLN